MSQTAPPSAGDETRFGAGVPSPRPRSRKHRLVFATFCLLLAALAGLLFAPDGGKEPPLQIHLTGEVSNGVYDVAAFFTLTNTGSREIQMSTLTSEINAAGQWTVFRESKDYRRKVNPGESVTASVWIPDDNRNWRARWVWFSEPTRLQTWQFQLKTRAGSILPAFRPRFNAWQDFISHTNCFPERPR